MIFAWLLACAPGPDDASTDPTAGPTDPTDTTPVPTVPDPVGPTFWRDAQPILADHCVSCHAPGEVGPMSLMDFDEVAPWAEAVAAVVEDGSMPPWPPADDCRPLEGTRSLSDDDRAALIDWVDAGAVEGDPADGVPVPGIEPFAGDTLLTMPEPYTPVGTDDYRCFVVDWPETSPTHVTAYQVEPGQREMVHHVLLYVASGSAADDARALDAADPRPGYTCFGSSGVSAATLGAWTPGVAGVELPEGTGIPVEPGSSVILQLHYNTAALPVPPADTSAVSLRLAADVDYPAAAVLVLNPGWLFGDNMAIGAGETGVTYEHTMSGATISNFASGALGTGPTDPIRIHRVGLHMHTLGAAGRVSVERAGGGEECLLDIERWDFDWQGAYGLAEPLTLQPADQVRLSCTWDNDAPGAVDVSWGDNTDDEMCISGLYVTR